MRHLTVDGVRVLIRCSGVVSARSASDRTDDWPLWYVTDDSRRNVLSFPDKPGAVLCSRALAERIAAEAVT